MAKRICSLIIFPAVLAFFISTSNVSSKAANGKKKATTPARPILRLNRETASDFCNIALRCIHREYPNKPSHVMNDETEVKSPGTLHPAFYGCFDWHSAVHGHWMLVRILHLFPDLPEAGDIRTSINENLTSENILAEVKYFKAENRKSFERTYGWAWLLKLAEELYLWDDPDGERWFDNLYPLVRVIVERYKDFLPRQSYPIRTGVHPNTAFGIAFALDYARAVGDMALEELLVERSITYFSRDREYPVLWEPGGEDFFSPCLMEADLMRRVMKPARFKEWFAMFLPELTAGKPVNILKPAIVADRSDPKIVHLDGLNLSRSWCMMGIISALPPKNRSREILMDAAIIHAREALAHIASGKYEGEHWLASFAVYMLSTADLVH